MATEVFANVPSTTVTSGGTGAPSGGTVETWTVASSVTFPAASTGVTQFHVGDPAATSEMILVTNVSGTTWTVTRGAEGSAPVTHSAGFTVVQVTTAGLLASLTVNPMMVKGDMISAGASGTIPARLALGAASSPLVALSTGIPGYVTDVINVMAYGAKGDGVTDDTAACQAALNATPAGATCWFPQPAAFYLVSSTLQIPNGVIVRGPSAARPGKPRTAALVPTPPVIKAAAGSNLDAVLSDTAYPSVAALPSTTVAAASDGGVISSIQAWSSPSAGVLAVASVAGFATAGLVSVASSNGTAQVTYTGVSGSTLTGCRWVSGGSGGTVSTGGAVAAGPSPANAIQVTGMVIDGNGASQSGGQGHGIVLMASTSAITNCQVQYTYGSGIVLADQTAAGVSLGSAFGGITDNLIQRCQVYQPGLGPSTTVAAGSNGGQVSNIASWSSPSAGVLAVASTTGLASHGIVTVATSNGPAQVQYTGTAGGNTLTGCTSLYGANNGTVATGGAITQAGAGVWVMNTTANLTDGYIYDVIVDCDFTGSALGIQCDTMSGWRVSYNHVYALPGTGYQLYGASNCWIESNYADNFGQASVSGITYYGFDIHLSPFGQAHITLNQASAKEQGAQYPAPPGAGTFVYYNIQSQAGGQANEAQFSGNSCRQISATSATSAGYAFTAGSGGTMTIKGIVSLLTVTGSTITAVPVVSGTLVFPDFRGAPQYSTPANPASTLSTSRVFAGTALIATPALTGKLGLLASGGAATQTAVQNVTVGYRYGASAGTTPTTVAAAANGGTISAIASWGAAYGGSGTLSVASTSGFSANGTIWVAASGTAAQVTYTAVAAGVFTGCAYVSGSATGTVSTGGTVSGWPQNGAVTAGTTIGVDQVVRAPAATTGFGEDWTILGQVTGLTPGSSYWLDPVFQTGNGADAAQIGSIQVKVDETA